MSLFLENELLEAIRQSNVQQVAALIACGADPNSGLFTDEGTALSLAVEHGNEEILEMLLRYGQGQFLGVTEELSGEGTWSFLSTAFWRLFEDLRKLPWNTSVPLSLTILFFFISHVRTLQAICETLLRVSKYASYFWMFDFTIRAINDGAQLFDPNALIAILFGSLLYRSYKWHCNTWLFLGQDLTTSDTWFNCVLILIRHRYRVIDLGFKFPRHVCIRYLSHRVICKSAFHAEALGYGLSGSEGEIAEAQASALKCPLFARTPLGHPWRSPAARVVDAITDSAHVNETILLRLLSANILIHRPYRSSALAQVLLGIAVKRSWAEVARFLVDNETTVDPLEESEPSQRFCWPSLFLVLTHHTSPKLSAFFPKNLLAGPLIDLSSNEHDLQEQLSNSGREYGTVVERTPPRSNLT